MYLLARRIKAMGIKMVLSGEGADEIFGGYLYFHKAPNANAMEDELVDKLSLLHYYDVQRANKSMMAWGVEVRVPFLDTKFLEVAMGKIAPETKMVDQKRRPMEKYILREAFSKPSTERTYLPDNILWRQKEQFSDGVGYGWIDALKKHAAVLYPDDKFQEQSALYKNYNMPLSPEALWYRNIFTNLFGNIKGSEKTLPENLQKTVACSTPRAVEWMIMSGNVEDPSGRTVKDIHNSKS
jgi:asparagine synthase (glutamine-hydrolysing)